MYSFPKKKMSLSRIFSANETMPETNFKIFNILISRRRWQSLSPNNDPIISNFPSIFYILPHTLNNKMHAGVIIIIKDIWFDFEE